MKNTLYLFLILLLGLISCSEKPNPKDIPFEMQPEGLKQAIEEEVLETMKKEVEESHRIAHEFYSNIPAPGCSTPYLRNTLRIKGNSAGRIIINGEINSSIIENTREFYLTNESLTREETIRLIADRSSINYNFPFYSIVTLSTVKEEKEKNQALLSEAINTGEPEYISYYERALNEWEKKLETIEMLELRELKEIHPQAYIDVTDQLNTEGFSPLTIEAIKGLIQVRDFAVKKYFGVSYLHLFFQATHYFDTTAEKQLDAINHLYPARIVDHSFAKSKGWLTDWSYEPVPVPEEITP